MSRDDSNDAYTLARMLLDDGEKTSDRHEALYYELAAILRTIRESLVIDQAAIANLVARQIEEQSAKVNIEIIVREMVTQGIAEIVNELRRQVMNRVNQLVIGMIDTEFKTRIKNAESDLQIGIRSIVDAMLQGIGGRR